MYPVYNIARIYAIFMIFIAVRLRRNYVDVGHDLSYQFGREFQEARDIESLLARQNIESALATALWMSFFTTFISLGVSMWMCVCRRCVENIGVYGLMVAFNASIAAKASAHSAATFSVSAKPLSQMRRCFRTSHQCQVSTCR